MKMDNMYYDNDFEGVDPRISPYLSNCVRDYIRRKPDYHEPLVSINLEIHPVRETLKKELEGAIELLEILLEKVKTEE